MLLIGHGLQKVFGWFGGHGPDQLIGTVDELGLEPAPLWAAAPATAETLGAALLVLGLLTPLAAAALSPM